MPPGADAELNRAARAALQKLESLQRAGVTHVARARAATSASQTQHGDTEARRVAHARDSTNASQTFTGNPAVESTAVAARGAAPPVVGVQFAGLPRADVASADVSAADISGRDAAGGDSLEIIRRDVAACTRCSALVRNRTQTVFGVGNPHPRLCFLGEAPGADEDRQGEPFVGRAGQLLNKIIEACTLRREDVYILNICKCRPPENRTPLPDEAANCRPFLDRQLALLKPEFICCLGAVAAQNLLGSQQTIGKLRGRVLESHGSRVVCTYHPAYLLRSPDMKKYTWEDMQMLMKLMGIELPQR